MGYSGSQETSPNESPHSFNQTQIPLVITTWNEPSFRELYSSLQARQELSSKQSKLAADRGIRFRRVCRHLAPRLDSSLLRQGRRRRTCPNGTQKPCGFRRTLVTRARTHDAPVLLLLFQCQLSVCHLSRISHVRRRRPIR